ncbi:MAG TPA: sigma-70 family RNA polymerase sigma factor [Phycisphaerales bacterium]|nr:sigma-70 family RNA polymerase sigma factor [Phycisphaerales bacterium]
MDLRNADVQATTDAFEARADQHAAVEPAVTGINAAPEMNSLRLAPQRITHITATPASRPQPRTMTNRRPVTDLVMNSMGFQQMSREREQELARAMRDQGDQHARAELIQAHVRLVTSIARGLANRGIPLDELVAEGNIGLIRAVDRFDPNAGARLSTFAFGHIRHAMTSLFRRNSVKGRLGHSTRRDVATLETAAARLQSRLGHEADDRELAEELGWTSQQVVKVRRVRDLVTNWSERLSHEVRLHAVSNDITDERPDERRRTAATQVERALAVLSPLERQVIELTFGLRTQCRMGSAQVAAVTGLAPREVTRIKTFAQLKLTRHNASVRRAS